MFQKAVKTRTDEPFNIVGFIMMVRWLFFQVFVLISLCEVSGQPTEKTKKLFDDSHFDELKVSLEKVGSGDNYYPEAQYYLGRIAVEQKHYETSIERFECAIRKNGNVAEYHNWLGVMYGVMAKDANPLKQGFLATKIKSEFETAALLEPFNLQTQWGLIHYYTKAPGFLGGSWEKAFDCAKVIAQQNTAQGLRARGFIHGAQKKTGIAEKEFIEATVLDPSSKDNAYGLAQFYEENGMYLKAMTVYESLVKKKSDKVAGYHIGKISGKEGIEFEKGIALLNQYISYKPRPNEPSHALAYFYLGMIYEKRGDKPRAKSSYATSLKLEPGLMKAKEGLERVD